MTVAELRKLLADCPDDMKVSFTLDEPLRKDDGYTPLQPAFLRQDTRLGNEWCEFLCHAEDSL